MDTITNSHNHSNKNSHTIVHANNHSTINSIPVNNSNTITNSDNHNNENNYIIKIVDTITNSHNHSNKNSHTIKNADTFSKHNSDSYAFNNNYGVTNFEANLHMDAITHSNLHPIFIRINDTYSNTKYGTHDDILLHINIDTNVYKHTITNSDPIIQCISHTNNHKYAVTN